MCGAAASVRPAQGVSAAENISRTEAGALPKTAEDRLSDEQESSAMRSSDGAARHAGQRDTDTLTESRYRPERTD
jgi:hypothetical protein